MILGIQIREIVLAEAQKSVDITSDGKSVRFDIYVEDPENRIYDLEMQSAGISGLPKRSRYYQGMIDLNTISKGEWYNKLRKSYVIFICLKDPFGAGQCMYTFEKFRQVFTRRKRVRRSGSKNS